MAVDQLTPGDRESAKGGSIKSEKSSKTAAPAAGEHGPRGSSKSGSAAEPRNSGSSRSRNAATDVSFLMEKYFLWETKTRLYFVGCDHAERHYRILKVDRTSTEAEGLMVTQDPHIYTRPEIQDLERMIDQGNNGLHRRFGDFFHGLVGFVRFTAGWYAVLITAKNPVALLGGHYIYNVADTHMYSVDLRPDKSSEEQKMLNTFKMMDMSKNFYFSFVTVTQRYSRWSHCGILKARRDDRLTYDLTNTLQHNMTRPVDDERPRFPTAWGYNDKFIWNKSLLQTAFPDTTHPDPWVLPLIYGSADQAKISVCGKPVFVTLVGRRSRHFAGARFMKRGVTDEGHVANEVETEQIVSETNTTPLWSIPARHDTLPQSIGRRVKMSPKYTAFVQLRGSIPVFWTQVAGNMQAKPPIHIHVVDPYFSAAALHFDDLFARYGTPIVVLNLVKTNDEDRETKLHNEFVQCIRFLNQGLPQEHRINYVGIDIAHLNKEKGVHVVNLVKERMEEVVDRIGFFHSGPQPASYESNPASPLPYRDTISLQRGLMRTNCIDCLDRTNMAQIVAAQVALGRQLHALGVLPDARIDDETPVMDLLSHMCHDLGDTIALQYGGSQLVNTMESYSAKETPGQWRSHTRDTINGIKRFYANSFSDQDKQRSIDLFLGVFREQRTLVPRANKAKRRSYIRWFSPENIERPLTLDDALLRLAVHASREPGIWDSYYHQSAQTRFSRLFAFKLGGTADLQMRDERLGNKDSREFSPFIPRKRMGERKNPEAQAKLSQLERWLSWQGLPSLPKRRAPWDKRRIQTQEAAKRTLPGSTEALARQFLDPVVDDALVDEYDDYVQQAILVSYEDRQIYNQSVTSLKSAYFPEPSQRALSMYHEVTDLSNL